MDTLLSVAMPLLGPATRCVPRTPPQPPRRRPMTELTNAGGSPERQPLLLLPPAASPPTPMTNLKLLTSIAAQQPAGPAAPRKVLFCADTENRPPPPPTECSAERATQSQQGTTEIGRSQTPLSDGTSHRTSSEHTAIPPVPRSGHGEHLGLTAPVPANKGQTYVCQVRAGEQCRRRLPQPLLAAASPGWCHSQQPLLSTPEQQPASVLHTPESLARPAAQPRAALVTPKLCWKRHASEDALLPTPPPSRHLVTPTVLKPDPGTPLPARNPLTPTAPLKPQLGTPTVLKLEPLLHSCTWNVLVQGTASRKDKSLSVLCDRFLEVYPLDVPGDEEMSLPLDETAVQLGTERRRIYDIVNVLESLHFSVRLEKNRHRWVGRRCLADTLGRLKGLAMRLGMPEQLRAALAACEQLQASPACPAPPTPEPLLPSPRHRGDRTLGVLTQKFVMLLLVSDRPSLSQDVVARALLGDEGPTTPDGQQKAKVRRLYDIANILQSVGLVRKEGGGKRPLFAYTGQHVQPLQPEQPEPGTQRSRHSLITTPPVSNGHAAGGVAGGPAATSGAAGGPAAFSGAAGGPAATSGAAAAGTHTGRTGGADRGCGWAGGDGGGRPLPRPPSLDDICRVTALERHRLFGADSEHAAGAQTALKRRLAEVQRGQLSQQKRTRPAAAAAEQQAAPAQRLAVRRLLIGAADGCSQRICVRRVSSERRQQLAVREAGQQLVAYQLVPVVRPAAPGHTQPETDGQVLVPVLYDESTCLLVSEADTAATPDPAAGVGGGTPEPLVALQTATPECLVTPGTMTFIREAISSGTIKACLALTPDGVTPQLQPGPAVAGHCRARHGSRASRRLQME